MNLADNLKKIRKDNNLSQEQLAEKLGVSRQAVSKWESGISYPEMDKVIQICNLFNLNINELINEDIKEVTENKEAQVRNNKYIASFFEYITKTIDMFSSMKLKEKIKCLFEQCVIACILFIILLIIGAIGTELAWSILQLLPDVLYYPIYRILEVLYIIMALVVGGAILLHIFKIRYLDYYEIVREPKEEIKEDMIVEDESKKDEDNYKKNKIILEKKQEKIIIRDPKHSEYKFITGLGKVLLWLVKLMACIVLGCFAVTLVGVVVCLPISFLIFRNFILFIGLILGIIGGVILNVVILELIYNFIVSKKVNKTRIFISSIIALILFGLGIGFSCVSATEFDIEQKEYDVVDSKYEFEMNEELILENWGYSDQIVFVEKNIDNVEVVVTHSDLYGVDSYVDGRFIRIHMYSNDENMFKYIREIIKGINESTIGIYDSQSEITVYANKKNIEILKNNSIKYDSTISRLEKQLDEAYIDRNKAQIENDRLKEVIINSNVEVITDGNGKIIGIKEYKEELE